MERSERGRIDDEYLAQVFDERARRLANLEARMLAVEEAVVKWAAHAETCERLQRAAAEERSRMANEQGSIKREQRLYTAMIFVALLAAFLEGHVKFFLQ